MQRNMLDTHSLPNTIETTFSANAYTAEKTENAGRWRRKACVKRPTIASTSRGRAQRRRRSAPTAKRADRIPQGRIPAGRQPQRIMVQSVSEHVLLAGVIVHL